MKPRPVIVSAAYWAALTLLAFGYGTYLEIHTGRLHNTESLGFEFGMMLLFLFVTFALFQFLWLYWKGYNYTRSLVMIALVLKFLNYARIAFQFAQFRTSNLRFALATFDILFSAYIFYWLTTKPAREYFVPYHGSHGEVIP